MSDSKRSSAITLIRLENDENVRVNVCSDERIAIDVYIGGIDGPRPVFGSLSLNMDLEKAERLLNELAAMVDSIHLVRAEKADEASYAVGAA